MSKKIVCLVLAFLLVLPVLVACSKDGDALQNTTDEASRYTTTLNMWVVTEDDTDPEQAAQVNEAINKFTKSRFKTKINIKFLKESEYYGMVEAAFAESAANRGSGSRNEVRQEETVLNDLGVPELKYPEVPDYQVDILYIGNYAKYREYADKGWILPVGSVINGVGQLDYDTAVRLGYYINPILLSSAAYQGAIYGVPNNRGIGEYTYLVIDGDEVGQYGYNLDSFDNISLYDDRCKQILDFIFNDPTNSTYPLYVENGELDLGLVHYWSFSADAVTGTYYQTPDKFSVFGGSYNNTDAYGAQMAYANLLTSSDYQKRLKTKLYYETTSGYITSNPTEKSALKVVKGGWELKEQYEAEGYSVKIIESPRAVDSDVFSSMFAIGNWTVDGGRSMEIITYINTNSELRNLLQYGVENVNYTLETLQIEGEDTEYVYVQEIDGNKYHMDVYKTGNVFLTYAPNAESVMQWEYEKSKNLDATTYPTLGFYFDSSQSVDVKAIQIMEATSAAVDAYMKANLTTVAAVDTFYARTAGMTGRDRNTMTAMATFLIEIIGTDVTYSGTDKVTVENLTDALVTMNTSVINEASGALQSPQALYNYWRENNGL